jgi:pyruvate,water dikinase
VLLRGFGGSQTVVPAHAVYSLDWFFPTAGEDNNPPAAETFGPERGKALAAEREASEAAAGDILRSHPRLLDQFDRLLDVTQRYVMLREEQARDLALGWPLLRRCADALGRNLTGSGGISSVDDIFFLLRDEIISKRSTLSVVAERRATWEKQRRLPAPITIGTPRPIIGDPIARAVQRTRGAVVLPENAIIGHPASVGEATGRVRIILGPEDFPDFRTGEILVARATAPAWTPLFARAAAVVTDSGTLAAHASLIAREYGIPAVVATGNATTLLHTGQTVTVNGAAGTVLPHMPHGADDD